MVMSPRLMKLVSSGSAPSPSLNWAPPSPASGNVNAPSGNFTATLVNGVADVVVTPSNASGTFSPTTRTLTTGSPAKTFTFTPVLSGVLACSLADDSGLADPAAVNYTANWAPDLLTTRLLQWLATPTYHSTTVGGRWPLLDAARTGTIREPRPMRCVTPDGTNDYGLGASRVSSGSPAAITFSGWFKAASNPAANDYLISEGTTSANRTWSLYINTSGQLVFEVSGNGTLQVTFTTTAGFCDGAWHHVAAVFSNAATQKIYVDAVDKAGTQSGTIPASLFNGAGPCNLFANQAAGGTFGGYASDFRVYSVAKSGAEITAIFNQANTPTTLDTTGLLAWWPLNEECCSVLHDVSGNAKHVIATSASTLPTGNFFSQDSDLPWSMVNEYGANYGLTMLKTVSGTWSGAWLSSNTLTGDGYVEFVVDSLAITSVFGLTSDSSISVSTNVHNIIDFGVAWATSTTIQLYENGAAATPSVTLAIGDRIRIRRTGTTLTVEQNGSTVATFASTSAATLYAIMASNSTSVTPDITSFNGATPTTMQTQSVAMYRHIVPRSLASPTLDVYGNTCAYTGQVPHMATALAPCITGNGTDSYVDFGAALLPASANFTLSFLYYHHSNNTTARTIFSQYTAAQSGRCEIRQHTTVSQIQWRVDDAATISIANALITDNWHRITLSRVGNDYTLTCQNFLNRAMAIGTATLATSLYTGRNSFGLIQAAATLPCDGEICDVTVLSGGVTKYFHCQEGPGNSSTNRTLYGWASDGSAVATGSLVNGTVATVWGDSCPFAKDYGLDVGCRVASGVTIPKGSGATAADGNALTHSAGEWANVSRNHRLNFNPYGASLLNGLDVETAYVGEADRESDAPTETKFRRTQASSELKDDRFFVAIASRSGAAVPTGLSGNDLTNAQTYVA